MVNICNGFISAALGLCERLSREGAGRIGDAVVSQIFVDAVLAPPIECMY